jgi:N-methylhydantoinase B
MTPIATGYDLIDVEVHQKSIRNIANEMAITLMRTSGSPVVTEAKDFSTCILDADVEQLAFSGFVTFHISTAIFGVEAVLRHTPLENIRPGDGFMCNDPHSSGAIHQGDVGIVVPFFYRDELVGWGYVNEHVLDIGGSAVSGFAPGAYDCFSETLAFPAVRVISEGRITPEWEQFIGTNVRLPGIVLNDIRSMVAGNNAGQRRLEALLDHIGLERFRALNEESKLLSEHAVRRMIEGLPDGTYESQDWVEFDGRGVQELHEVRLRLTIEGDEMTIQFRGDPQTDSFINGARPAMIGQSWSTLLSQLIYDIPINAGIWRPIHFDLGPQGTVVNSVPPAPVSQSHMETGMKVNKVLADVFSQACALSSEPILAGRVAGQCAQDMSFFTAFGIDRRTGTPTVAFPVSLGMASGGGAQTVSDGLEIYAGQCMPGCDMPEVEMEETTQPGMILWRSVQPDTGGAGIHRGGLGATSALAILHCDRMTGGAFSNCSQVPPRGSAGGYPGAAGRWRIIRDSNILDLLERGIFPVPDRIVGRVEQGAAKNGHLVLDRGDIFVSAAGGGGGVGDPILRDPELVARDVLDGYVSREAALDVYGVRLEGEGNVDRAATAAERSSIRARRVGHSVDKRVVADDVRFAPLHVRDGHWHCAACNHDLGEETENWRDSAVRVQREISERYKELHSQVRTRTDGAAVVLRENFCPECATSLAVDVSLEGRSPVAASRVGVIERFPED